MNTTTIDILGSIAAIAGFAIFSIGLISLVFSGGGKPKIRLATAIVGFILVAVAGIILIVNNENIQGELAQEVATMLDTTPENIVIEDLTERSTFFGSNKNHSLRRVVFDGKAYLLEVNGTGNKVGKLVETQFTPLPEPKK